MEHKILLGDGEQYLPFARSRIKALRATGLEYASNKFVLPDATVHVKIEPGYEYIRIEGTGSCVFHMDSGIVDVLAIGEAAPARYTAGALIESNNAKTYNAPFVAPSEGDTTWRLNPGETGQISGSLYSIGGKFTGRVPYDLSPARSFKPALRAVSPATDPATYEDNPADDNLAAKKRLAVLCPPSIFTGRCRLYIQAVYGQHLNTYKGNNVTGSPPLPEIVSGTSAAPALMFNAYRKSSDPAGATVLVDTSCGVWLDPATGKHWLLNPIGSQLFAFPLISSKCGEGLRKYLITVDPPDDITPLNDADRAHLEAYILASCLPYDAQKIVASGAVTGSVYSMSYGWHWNWSGTRADAVVNTTFDQADGNGAMRSTHYRITVAHSVVDGADQWAALQTTVEGPTDWAVYRAHWTIAEPNWSALTLIKSTPSSSTVFACGGAPFYCFYVGDELQTCRVSVTLELGNPSQIIEDNCFGDECLTMGLTEGSRTIIGAGANYYSAVFTCGSASTPSLPVGKVVDYQSVTEVKNKRPNGFRAGYGSGGHGQRNFEVSDYYGGGRHFITESSTLNDDRKTMLMSHDTVVTSKRQEFPGRGTVVVPLYDAQAVYLESRASEDTYYTGNTTFHLQHTLLGVGGAFIVRYTTSEQPGGWDYAKYNGAFAYADLELVGTEYLIPQNVYTVTNDSQRLICHAGVVPATFSHLNELHNNLVDEVGAAYATLSSTDLQNPVVIAPGYVDAIGVNGHNPAAPVLVGWI